MKSYKEIAEALKGKQHKIDKNKNGKIDAHDFKLLRKEESELTEATVKTQKYSWGTMKTVHHGADFSIPLHPEHHQAIAKLKDEQEHKFKTEDGKHWTARRKGDEVHFQGANNGGTTKVKHADLKESVGEDDEEERMSRSDYKVSPSGRKSHKEIVFKHGESDKKDLEEGKMTDAEMKKREEIVKSMKKNMAGFKDRYGDRAKEVMYATATKMAMKEESEELEERDKQNATMRKMMDASRGARFKAAGNPVPDAEPEHKTAQAHNKAIGRALRKEDTEQVEEGWYQKPASAYRRKDEVPFDGPYTKVKGDVKDKSGAVHTPASRAKHLARMAMKKQMKEDIDRLFEKDDNEYNYEGEMAVTQLKTIMRHAEALQTKMQPDTNLPEWVQSKITLAADYIQTASDYLHSEIEEQAPVAPVPGQKWKDHAVMVNGKQRVVIKRSNAKNYPEHEGWKEVSPGQKLKEEDEVNYSYTELMMMLEYESKGGVYRHTGSYGSEYAKKEREKDEKGFDADDKPTTNLTKRGRGRPAGSKSGARGPRIK